MALWWTTFACFAVLCSVWSIGLPLFAAPDEPAHQIRAASVARGQLLGRQVAPGSPLEVVRAPLSLLDARATCFAFRAGVSASCQPALGATGGRLHDAVTYVGRYPPVYYAAVGLFGRLPLGLSEPRTQRLGSALLCAALLASAVVSLRSWPGSPGAAGLALALTPMTLFLCGTVNPSGLETAAAIGLWVGGLALLEPRAEVDVRLVVRVTFAAIVLVLVRPLSPFWLACVTVVLLASAPWQVVRGLARRRAIQLGGALTAAASAAAVAWIVLVRALVVLPSSGAERPRTVLRAAQVALSMSDERFRQMIGNFGWLDDPVQYATIFVWLLGLGALLLPALVARARRRAFALAFLIVMVVLLPVLIEASQAQRIGYDWAGRYTLPLAVGVPLVAARAMVAEPDDGQHRRLDVAVVLLTGAGQLWAFVNALARYTVGTGHGLGLRHPQWTPPLPPAALCTIYAVGLVALANVLLRAQASERGVVAVTR